MRMKNTVLLLVVFISLGISGCVGKDYQGEKAIGGDKDEHGCLIPAGYTWCEVKQKCLRVWEENCSSNITVGGEKDEHGCLVAAGYSWCEAKNKCIRMWEGYCPLTKSLCEQFGGGWRECGNKCVLDNQGREDVVCASVCESLCECGGLRGLTCPPRYACKTPKGIADALGYCIREAKSAACPEDAKLCPDGTAVSRTGPNCEFPPCPSVEMSYDEAVKIAQKSECTEKGELTADHFYNNNSKTWWINLKMKDEFKKEFCNPACVVSEDSKTAEINWRCTGLLR
jgi:hypothetical protein